ncbi:MAG TPA: TolC family protein [Vicinamibacterales bacterium]|nr:TolC family protein [Vicinamibacterales bacterium]
MRTIVFRACIIAVAVSSGTPVFVSAQTLFPITRSLQLQATAAQQPTPGTPATAQAAQPPAPVRRLSADDAVKLAVENNLGLQIARVNPQIQDLNLVLARSGWTPTFTSTLQSNSNTAPNQNIFAGGQGLQTTTDQFASNVGIRQAMRWGGTYEVGWDSSRLSSNSVFSTFSPQLRTSMSLAYTQPLLRNWSIDNTRQQVLVSAKNREMADVDLRQTLASTIRTVRNAYWDLAYAVASLTVQQQSLELAQESLRNTRARVEIGTTPPIDIVEAESEVATRQEAVIVAQAQIETSEDTLRALVFNPSMPDFWTIHIEPTELPDFKVDKVDTDGAVRTALDHRTDLINSRKSLEVTDINIRYYRNQSMPDVTADFNYGLQGLGGTFLQRGAPGPTNPFGEVIGQSQRGFSTVLGDLFHNTYPSWTAAVNVSYPIGTSQADANLARTKLQRAQEETQLRNQELQVATQVRQAARQVQTNQQRVQTTQASRELAARKLEAEQRKFTAGTSTSFQVFQAQRDLAQARNNELRAILDYARSVVDLETVQEVPVGGGAAVSAVQAQQVINNSN